MLSRCINNIQESKIYYLSLLASYRAGSNHCDVLASCNVTAVTPHTEHSALLGFIRIWLAILTMSLRVHRGAQVRLGDCDDGVHSTLMRGAGLFAKSQGTLGIQLTDTASLSRCPPDRID